MALENFIKTLWLAGIMRNLKKTHVYASLANRNYEGSLKNLGDTVKVLMIGDIAVKAYTKRTNIAAPDPLTDAARILTADQAHYFNFSVDDVEAVQEKTMVLDEATMTAAYGISDVVDQYFAGMYAQSGIKSYASGTTPHEINSANVEDVFLAVGEAMDSNNIPRENRFAVIPPWVHTKLVQAGLTTKTSNDELYANGMIGKVLNFNMRLSNNVHMDTPATVAGTHIICGIPGQTFSYAEVINSLEAYRPEQRFEDAIKGLFVYAGKMMRPDMAATIYCNRAAEA